MNNYKDKDKDKDNDIDVDIFVIGGITTLSIGVGRLLILFSGSVLDMLGL